MAEAKKEKKVTNFQYLRDKMAEKVKGVFHFYERPGGTLEFEYKFFKGDPIERYSLNDGEKCEIPLGVAKHLCTSGRYPVHEHKLDENGKPSLVVGHNVARYGFESLEFTDIDLGRKNELIPEVTRVE